MGVEAVPLNTAPDLPPSATPPATPSTPRLSAAPIPDPAPSTATEPATREQKIALLKAIQEQEVAACTRCGLCQGRTHAVFGEGDPDARLMFIGEGPGQREDELGRPFVGRAGDLLAKMITAMGLTREQVYITNVVKCRPPNNRTPSPDEVATCWPYLQRQIQIIRPQVIVTLGGPATKTILDTKDGITRLRGKWHQFPGIDPPVAVMPTFHPAFLLRQYTEENRGRVWSDLQAVMQRLGMGKP